MNLHISDNRLGIVDVVSQRDVAAAAAQVQQARALRLEGRMSELMEAVQTSQALVNVLQGVHAQIKGLVALLPADNQLLDDQVPDTPENRKATYDTAYAALRAEMLLPLAEPKPVPSRQELIEANRMVELQMMRTSYQLSSDMLELNRLLGKRDEVAQLQTKLTEVLAGKAPL